MAPELPRRRAGLQRQLRAGQDAAQAIEHGRRGAGLDEGEGRHQVAADRTRGDAGRGVGRGERHQAGADAHAAGIAAEVERPGAERVALGDQPACDRVEDHQGEVALKALQAGRAAAAEDLERDLGIAAAGGRHALLGEIAELADQRGGGAARGVAREAHERRVRRLAGRRHDPEGRGAVASELNLETELHGALLCLRRSGRRR